MKIYRINQAFVFIIFGASGDLAKLKLFPAIYALALQKRLPKEFFIVGYARTEKSRKKFQKEFEQAVKDAFKKDLNKKILKELIQNIYYYSGQYDQVSDFKKFRKYLKDLTNRTTITKLAYFSVPPIAFKSIIENLGKTKISAREDLRLIIEKPFGSSTRSAKNLFHFVARYFEEEDVYLLDHYLGKSAVQSILHLRHANRLLNLMMKGPEVSNIQITASETLGVHDRVSYYEKVGSTKDMVQSHLLQILALITMSIPITENADSLHREKNNILSALQFTKSPKNLVIGQYEHYRDKKDVPPNSKTETFTAVRLFIDRESWYKVPIYIRTGKKLKEKHTYITIEFKKFAFQSKDEEPNRLIIELQPEEKVTIKLVNKSRSSAEEYETISTSDSIACTGDFCLPEHGLLILDVMRKKKEHFLCFPEIIASWKITDSIIEFIRRGKVDLEIYKQGSIGPTSQKKLTKTDGFKWYEL